MANHRLHIDQSDEDEEFLKSYKEDVEMLLGLVEEMFVKNEVLLLSETMRSLLVKHKDQTAAKHDALKDHLRVDNPGDPFAKKMS